MKNLSYQKLQTLQTPTYLYSEEVLRAQVKALRESLPEEMGIFYSFKANSHERLAKVLQSEGVGADVASVNELKVALRAQFKSEHIEFTGPGKSEEALRLAIHSRIASIVVESVEELLLINQISTELKIVTSISLRVNPELSVSATGKKLNKQSSQFGVDEDQAPEFFAILKKCSHVKLVGLHVFSQSQILSGQILEQNFALTMAAILRLCVHLTQPLDMVNLGGGFGIPYYEGQSSLQMTSLKSALVQILTEARKESVLQAAKFFVESGRFIAGPAGVYAAPVLYTKESQGKRFVVLGGGFSHNMAVCGVGQILRRNYKTQVFQKQKDTSLETVTLVGPSCYALDTLAVDLALSRLVRGDWVIFENCGSYGASFSPMNFLSFAPAQERFIEDL
ncbi:MAG: alanine racemase [Bdellovibrio sp.]|nr:alanine racemase [Bdellovibrio sp.]